MIRKMNLSKEQRIRIKDIPLTATMGELALNVSKAYKVMEAISEGRTQDAFDIAREILNDNDAIIERQVDKATVMEMINGDIARRN